MKSIITAFKSYFIDTDKPSVQSVKLKKGEKIQIKIPEAMLGAEVWQISKWYVNLGDYVMPGNVLCEIKSKNKTSNFESFMEGQINYINTSNNKLEKNMIMVEIVGVN
jgi:hypothetical protein